MSIKVRDIIKVKFDKIINDCGINHSNSNYNKLLNISNKITCPMWKKKKT